MLSPHSAIRSWEAVFIFLASAVLSAYPADSISNTPGDYVTKESDWKKLRAGEVIILTSSKKREEHGATSAILVDAPPKAVWAVIADKEGAPDYIDSLESAKVTKETKDHILIEQVMKLGPLPRVTYVVKHIPKPPHTVLFERDSGDLKEIDGFWKFLPVDQGKKCLLIYHLELKPGFLVPGFVIKRSLKKSLPDALRAVRDQVDD